MSHYAQGTAVSTAKSRAEIEDTILRFGASKFMSGMEDRKGYIAFIYKERAVRFTLPLPTREEYRKTPGKRVTRSDEETYKAWEQGCREKWRALLLTIKGMLVGVDAGIVSFEKAFLGHTLLPSGQTVADWMEPQIVTLLETGQMPKLLVANVDGD